MTYTEPPTRLALILLGIVVALLIGYVAYRGLARPMVDPRTGSAGLAVETDAETGCQYVVTPWGGIFARLGSDGKPLCRTPTSP